MTDHNTNHAEEQAAIREAQEHACAEYLFANFDWSARTAEVEEILSLNCETLTAAHRRFMEGYGLDLRLLLNKAAMELCEVEAKRLVGLHVGDWLFAVEGDL